MNGEELKQYIKRSGMSVAAVAEKLGTSPQNLNAKLFLANFAHERFKLFSGIVLRDYNVNVSERKFRGKSENNTKNTPAVKKSSRWGNKWKPL